MVDKQCMDVFYDYFSRHVDLSAADRSPWIIAAAIVQTLIGVVYLLWGWRIFNIVIMLQAALFGAILGFIGGGAAAAHFELSLWAGIACMAAATIGGAVALIFLSKLLIRFIFAIQAGFAVAGLAVLTLEAARVSIPQTAAVIGAIVVILVTAVLVYRKFAVAVMAMMSLQGAVLTVAGVSMLIAAVLESNHAVRPMMALIAVAVLATPSFMYQRSRGQVMGQKASGAKSSKSSTGATRRKAA